MATATYRRTIYVINQGIITRRDITKQDKVATYPYLESPKVNQRTVLKGGGADSSYSVSQPAI